MLFLIKNFSVFAECYRMVLTLERVFMVQSVLNKGGKYSQEVQDLFAENSDKIAYLIDTVLVHA